MSIALFLVVILVTLYHGSINSTSSISTYICRHIFSFRTVDESNLFLPFERSWVLESYVRKFSYQVSHGLVRIFKLFLESVIFSDSTSSSSISSLLIWESEGEVSIMGFALLNLLTARLLVLNQLSQISSATSHAHKSYEYHKLPQQSFSLVKRRNVDAS